MENETERASARAWNSTQVYAMAAISLMVGLTLGYLFRASESRAVPAPPMPTTQAAANPGGAAAMPTGMPTLADMKHMADKQAEPLLAKLKTDPNNADTLKQVARIYESTHQFEDAAGYFGRALAANPKDAATRTALATCLYYSGDVDGALAQLQQALQSDPGNANSLFNLGIMRWKGKNDAKGALQAWEQLLKSNPQLESGKKAQVEKLMAEAKQGSAN